MLERILREIKNYFIREVWVGTFRIEDGALNVDFLQDGQYFKIAGSVMNDGVYRYPAYGLTDEDFDGEVWALAIPAEIVSLSEEIASWMDANANVLRSPFSSESFGGYSYTKASSSGGGLSGVAWQSVFADRLRDWRKIRYEFAIRRHDPLRTSR